MNQPVTASATGGRFGTLLIDARIAENLAAIGYHTPTPIQEHVIPLLQARRNVTGLARTGSGKTAGFGIPLLESISVQSRTVQALVLVPTRELAAQVAQEMTRLAMGTGIRIAAIFGGVSMGPQITALRGDTHVVIGTPGRLLDHLSRGTLDLRAVRLVVLDEADRMLDVGFAPAIDNILRRVPTARQMALFSATFPTEVEALVMKHAPNAVRIETDRPGTAIETLEQRFLRVADEPSKIDALHDILIGDECRLALIFRRTTHRADRLARDLERRGFSVAVMHGRRSQAQRERALEALRSGKLKALVATDIAARGLDIAGLTHVVNFDLPDTADTYTHRIGRTARMGADGVAITIVTPEDEALLKVLTRRLATVAPAQRTDAGRPPRNASRPAMPRPKAPQKRALPQESPAVQGGARRLPSGGRQGNPSERNAAATNTNARKHGSPRPQPVERAAVGATSAVDEAAWYPFEMPSRATTARR